MREVIFWGATGQAKVLRECLENDVQLIALFDTNPKLLSPFNDVPLIGGRINFKQWMMERKNLKKPHFSVAIGGERGKERLQIQEYLEDNGLMSLTIVHRSAFVASDVHIGTGSQILAHSTICVGARIGRACIVNTAASIDHECDIADGVHIAPGARLAGCIKVEKYAMVGTGAVILPRLTIGEGAIVGAGAVVLRDVKPYTVVAGNPAHLIRSLP